MTTASVFIPSASATGLSAPNPIASIIVGATGHLNDHKNLENALWYHDYYLSTSAGLASAVADETGAGSLVFSASPTLSSPILNSPTLSSPTFSSVALITNPTVGKFEFEGNAFYLTSNTTASSRGIVPTQLFGTVPAAGVSINNAITTAQNIFPSTASSIVLSGSTTYELDAYLAIQIPATTNTGGAGGFGFAGTATFGATNGFGYGVMASSISNNSANNGNYYGVYVTSTASFQVFVNTASSTTPVYRIANLKGIVKTNASGTFIPQFYWSTAPVGTSASSLIMPSSYIRLTPLGDSNFTNTSAWHA